MRKMTFGVIAITSTLTFACSMNETTTDPGPTGAGDFRSRLSLSRPEGNAAALSSKLGRRGGGGGSGNTGGFGHLSSGSGAGACGLSSGDATCDSCLGTSCCAESTACVGDADCTALITCGNACTDDTCFSSCLSAHPTGASLLGNVLRCVDSSCSSACGGGGPPPSGPPGGTCGFDSGDTTCNACFDTNCCADANACLGDSDCIALLTCAETCSGSTCYAACESAHPTGAAKLAAISTCIGSTCGTACGAPPSGPGPGGPGPGPGGPPPASCGLTSGAPTCDACLDASCCAPTTACVNDADCVALIRCYDLCSDSTCASACDTAHPSGLSKLDAVYTCVTTSCSSACGF